MLASAQFLLCLRIALISTINIKYKVNSVCLLTFYWVSIFTDFIYFFFFKGNVSHIIRISKSLRLGTQLQPDENFSVMKMRLVGAMSQPVEEIKMWKSPPPAPLLLLFSRCHLFFLLYSIIMLLLQHSSSITGMCWVSASRIFKEANYHQKWSEIPP